MANSQSLSDLKKELNFLSLKEITEICIKLAKYKKDNKEFLSYLLFRSNDTQTFVSDIKIEIDGFFEILKSQSNLYLIKKSLRKILRLITKNSKYVNEKSISIELLIYFCKKLKLSGIPFHKSQLISNIYQQQLKKINKLIPFLHEDIQADYCNEIKELEI